MVEMPAVLATCLWVILGDAVGLVGYQDGPWTTAGAGPTWCRTEASTM